MASLKITADQRNLIVRLSIYLFVIVILSIISIYFGGVVDDYEKKHSWLKNDIVKLQGKLSGLNEQTREFSDSVKIWNSMTKEDKKLEGLRINDAKDVLDDLKNRYNLTALKVSFSKPEEILGDYETDSIVMISSLISLSFNVYSDEFIYKFINGLSNKFPGHVQIKSLSIGKSKDITKEVIRDISTGKEIAVIPVKMEFHWHDFKYKTASAEDAKDGGSE